MLLLYEIPMMLILVFLVAVVVFGIIIAPIVAFICMTILLMAYWIINFKLNKGLVPARVISVVGAISAFFIAVTLSDSISTIKSFLIIVFIMSVISLLLYKVFKKKSPMVTICSLSLCLVFSLMWTIGYEMVNRTKVYYGNLAYYECDQMEFYETDSRSVEKAKNNGKQLNGNIYDITDNSVLNITDDHIIGTYKEGDLITPNLEESTNTYANTMSANEKITWYPVLTETGQNGYIPDTGVNLVYYDNSNFVKDRVEHFKPTTWYAYLPDIAVRVSEKLYETLPFYNRVYLTK
ncbi:MAG: hypothetical protein K0S18_1819 [Anaerocolumna sp.]|nr:hypothetical protein [Anaerocolumna sp.]